MRKGIELAKGGDDAGAILSFRKAIQARPKWSEAHYQLGLALQRKKQMQDALDELGAAVREDPEHRQAQIELGKLDLQFLLNTPKRPKRNYDNLQKITAALLGKDPASAEGNWFRGELAMMDNRLPEALEAFEKARQAKDAPNEATRGAVRALIANRNYEEAERQALALIAKDKTYGQIYDDLYGLYRVTKRDAQAEALFRRKVESNPENAAYRLQLAAHYANKNDTGGIKAALEPLIAGGKQFPEGPVEAVEFYGRLSMWDEADAVCRKEIEANSPNKLKARKLMIRSALARGQREQAGTLADEIVKEGPDDPEARFLRASLWIESSGDKMAKAALEELEPFRGRLMDHAMAQYVLGEAYRRTGNARKAEASYRDALKIDPTLKPAYKALIEMALRANQVNAALDWTSRALDMDDQDGQWRLLRGKALLAGGRLGEARSELSALAGALPSNSDVQMEYALVLIAERKLDMAETIFRRFYTPGKSDLRAVEGLARIHLERGQTAKAYQMTSEEAAKRTSTPELKRLLAMTAFADKKPDVAIRQYEELLRTEPDVSELHYHLALAQRQKGDEAAMTASLNKSIQANPANHAPLAVLAVVHQSAGRPAEAEALWRKVLELRPNDLMALNNLAFLLADSGKDFAEARKFAEKAVRGAPESAMILDTLGWVFWKQKDYPQAVQTFRAAARKAPDDPSILLHLGMALNGAGNKTEARNVLEGALRKRPKPADEAKIKEELKRAA